jgi:hypothetical protein
MPMNREVRKKKFIFILQFSFLRCHSVFHINVPLLFSIGTPQLFFLSQKVAIVPQLFFLSQKVVTVKRYWNTPAIIIE